MLRLARHVTGRALDRGYDLRVRTAAADVAVHDADDLVVRRARRRLEERGGGHDHADGAVAALHRGLFDEGLLERVETAVALEAFYVRDLFAFCLSDADLAGAAGFSVEEDGAGAALAFAAGVLGAGKGELLADNAEEVAVRANVEALAP